MTAKDVKVNSVQPDKNGTLSHMKIQKLKGQSYLSVVASDVYSIPSYTLITTWQICYRWRTRSSYDNQICLYIHTQSLSFFSRWNKDSWWSKEMFLLYFIYTSLFQEIKSGVEIIFESIKVPARQSNALEWKCFRVNHGCATSLPKLILNQKSDRPRTLKWWRIALWCCSRHWVGLWAIISF